MPRKSRPTTLPTGANPALPAVNPAVPQPDPKYDEAGFPIVAVGASAGGLSAFQLLLAELRPDTGMAFILIQHLDPHHESLLSEILARSTRMPVQIVENQVRVEPNRVYVIPPNKDMVYSHGRLELAPRTEIRGQHRPIDHFMRSLAEEHTRRAIGIVLSGTASDGTLGLHEIKTAGGITIAQDKSAEHQGMPRSAIESGYVDLVLAPAQIAKELERIAMHPFLGRETEQLAANETVIARIIEAVRTATGVDFSNYKRKTLQRRITRRVVLHRLEGFEDYLRMLLLNPSEVENLYQDILINVTSFFRDPEAYEALKEQVFPRLCEGKSRNQHVRVWTLGCSTGEEAYSIAMCWQEFAESSQKRIPLQIFATDLNASGIERARAGYYPRGIAQDVSSERLQRFFVGADGNYRIAKSIRDMCVFAQQNVLSDPPFSRIDLIACRNLLIYLEPVLQHRLMPMLHYSLRPGGYLWLGNSETIGGHRELFEPVDVKNKIYVRKDSARRILPAVARAVRETETRGGTVLPAVELAVERADPQREADRILLSRYAPPAVVLDDSYEILHFRGDTSPYLAPAAGKASLNLLKMLREGLMVGVRGALQRAKRERAAVRTEGLGIRDPAGPRMVDVIVVPMQGMSFGSYLVAFEQSAGSPKSQSDRSATEAHEESPGERDVERLTQELTATREYLQAVIEQQEAANEELQSATEEVQSANEELQSINEELETSKEEIQSSNEELATVNDELQSRNLELARANDDLNLFASLQIPIVMLSPEGEIRRFTPAARQLNLLPTDIGRSIHQIKLSVAVPDLESILSTVRRGESFERAVQGSDGRWHSLQIVPYRTEASGVEGLALLLVDIDAIRRSDAALAESEMRYISMANSAPVLIWTASIEGIRFANHACEVYFGKPLSELSEFNWRDLLHEDDRDAFLSSIAAAIRERQPFEALARMRRHDGAFRLMKSIANPNQNNESESLVGTSVDVTELVTSTV